ncbi:MAG: GGDEF domain-containing protein [Thalassotalea sp.]
MYNKRFFNQQIETLWNISKRHNYSICVLMIDIDFFKPYNDFYGHLAGDDAIKSVAECLTTTFKRADDLVARFGGEEFICVTINVDDDYVHQLAEKLIRCLAEKKIPHLNSTVDDNLTVSIGSINFDENLGDIEKLIKEADKALYQAKAQGRNRHVHSLFSEKSNSINEQ